ncbi:hypothetical protein niasHT_026839 [Heterodera trifolii]|uniref:Uncharacterized protein n=1 Tax=Heterodera trifolii TaxID=157864 RepID=A0ABD2K4E5_9BILA
MTLTEKRSSSHFSPPTDNTKRLAIDNSYNTLGEKLANIGRLMNENDDDGNNSDCSISRQLFQICVTLLQQVQSQQNELFTLKQRQIADEAVQDHERRRSVVVMGLPESQKQKPSERVAADRTAISGVLDELGIESPITAYRMGSPDQAKTGQNRPRLMKVIFGCSKHQKQTLAQWNKLRLQINQKLGMSNIRIRPSLSQEELKARRVLQEECSRKRKEDGGEWVVYADKVMLRSDIPAFKNSTN